MTNSSLTFVQPYGLKTLSIYWESFISYFPRIVEEDENTYYTINCLHSGNVIRSLSVFFKWTLDSHQVKCRVDFMNTNELASNEFKWVETTHACCISHFLLNNYWQKKHVGSTLWIKGIRTCLIWCLRRYITFKVIRVWRLMSYVYIMASPNKS